MRKRKDNTYKRYTKKEIDNMIKEKSIYGLCEILGLYTTNELIRVYKSEYWCSKCERTHNYNTKIWNNHFDKKIAWRTITKEMIREGFRLKNENIKVFALSNMKYKKETQIKLEEIYSKIKPELDKGRFFYFEICGSYGFRQIGRYSGYKTLEELEKDEELSIKSSEKGDSISFILEAKPIKIIKKF